MNKILFKYSIIGMAMMCSSSVLAKEDGDSNAEDASGYIELYEKYKANISSNSNVSNFVCGDSFSNKVNDAIARLTPNVCAQLNTDPDLENNPYAYENPQASCDLGASLNGLPDWDGLGFSMDGVNACGLLDMVAGDKIREKVGALNDYSQGVSDGLTATKNIDLDGMMKKTLGD